MEFSLYVLTLKQLARLCNNFHSLVDSMDNQSSLQHQAIAHFSLSLSFSSQSLPNKPASQQRFQQIQAFPLDFGPAKSRNFSISLARLLAFNSSFASCDLSCWHSVEWHLLLKLLNLQRESDLDQLTCECRSLVG